MSLNINKEVARMKRMATAELKDYYDDVCGHRPRSHNRDWLVKKIAWQLQAAEDGGLPERVRQRALAMADDADLRKRPPRSFTRQVESADQQTCLINREAKRLVVNEAEAVRVRQIFDLYLEHQGLIPTVEAIVDLGWRTKLWVTKSNKTVGGVPFNKNALHALLTNRIYLGKVTYRDEVYEGEHDAIVDPESFELVQKQLRGNRINSGDRVHGRSAGVLSGLLYCGSCNAAMSHTVSSLRNENKRYRYYVCGKAAKRGRKTCPRASLPAQEVEQFVIAQLQSLTIGEDLLLETCSRVQRSVSKRRNDLAQEQSTLASAIHQTERAIDALSTPSSDPNREATRLESLATLTDQHHRDQRRLETVNDQLRSIETASPDRVSILRAIKDLESLWEHLTIGERSRLMSLLIERIEHDPVEGDLSITLSPAGLQSFSAGTHTSQANVNP